MFNKIKLKIVVIFAMLSSPVFSEGQLSIYGEWIGKDHLGNGIRLVISPKTMDFYWTSNSNPDYPLPENESHSDIVFFKSLNSTDEYIALKPGTGYVTRLVVSERGQKLSTHRGGQRGAEARLVRKTPCQGT